MHLEEGNQDKALSMYREGLAIQEAAFGKDSPRLANTLRNYAGILNKVGMTEQAEQVLARLKKITGK